jgi:hypothetical protein
MNTSALVTRLLQLVARRNLLVRGQDFIGKTPPQDVLAWKAPLGSYELIALDDHGRASSAAITVQ